MAKSLILASTSKYRAELLTQLGFSFTQVAPLVDETVVQNSKMVAKDKAEKLALLKAQAVYNEYPDALVLGGDQIPALGEEILCKPSDADGAFQQLRRLRGQSHYLYTAIALVGDGVETIYTDVTELKMRSLSDEEIRAYIAADQPFDCAGAYKFECGGRALFEYVKCDDETAITGLPLAYLGPALDGLLSGQ